MHKRLFKLFINLNSNLTKYNNNMRSNDQKVNQNKPYPIPMITNDSFDSIPELAESRFCIKIYFIILILLITINGLYLLYFHKDYFASSLLFPKMSLLIAFVYLYSFGVINAVIASFILTLIIYGGIVCCSKLKPKPMPLKSYEENKNLDWIEYYEGDHVSYLTYLFNVFVIIIIVLYLSAIPLSIYLMVLMATHSSMKKIKVFYMLYCFLSLNCLTGFSLLCFGLMRFIFGKINASVRKQDLNIDEDYINEIRNEIRNTIKEDKGNFNNANN